MTGRLLDSDVSMTIQMATDEGWVTEVHRIGNVQNGLLLRIDRDIFTAEFSFPTPHGRLERFDESGRGSKHQIGSLRALHEILQSSHEDLVNAFEIKPDEEKTD